MKPSLHRYCHTEGAPSTLRFKFARVALASLAMTGLACARPNYATNGSTAPQARSKDTASPCAVRFSVSGYCVSMAWLKEPTEDEFGIALLKITRPNLADGTPLLVDTSSALEATLWMPDMGHGSSPVHVERVDLGTYKISDVFFSMHGNWQLHVKTQGKDEAIIDYRF